jgi:lambda family phage tail tape measure protein
MADSEQIGVARIDVVVDSSNMPANLKTAERAVSGFGDKAEAEFNRANKSSKAYAGSLLRQIETTNKTRLEQIAYNAQLRIGGELGKQIAEKALAQQAAMDAVAGATGKASHAIHEFSLNNSFARRELGRLVSDIANGNYGRFEQTSLTLANASGLLGKVFTKTGAAAVAMAVGVGGLIKILADGENETFALNKALLETGNIADTTIPKLQALAEAIAKRGPTHGQASDAVQQVAATGQFVGDQLDLVAAAAARMEEATGQSIDSTIKKFEEIGRAPVDALLKLNETEHFLTRAQLDRVQALVDEGRQQDAASEGAKIYAQRLNDIATAADEARPHLARMFSDAKHQLSDLVEGTKNFAEFLAAAADKYKQMPWYERGPFGAVGHIKSLFGAEPIVPTTPKPVANTVDSGAEEAARKAQAELAKFASPGEQLKKAEDDAKKAFAAAIYGVSDPATIAKYRAEMERQVEEARQRILHATKGATHAIRPSAADAGAAALASFQQYVGGLSDRSLSVEGDAALTQYVQGVAKLNDELDKAIGKHADLTRAQAAYDQGMKDLNRTLDKNEAAQHAQVQEFTNSLNDQLAARKALIDVTLKTMTMGPQEAANYKQLAEVTEQATRAIANFQRQHVLHPEAMSQDEYEAELKALKQYWNDVYDYTEEGQQRVAELQGDFSAGMQAGIDAFIEETNNKFKQGQQFIQDFTNGFSDAFVQFATGAESAKKAFGDFIDQLFADALRIEANQFLASLLEKHQQGGSSGSGEDWFSALIGAVGSFFGGGKAGGGMVDAGPLYRVNEQGPELLTVGNVDYLMMGSKRGHVTPSDQSLSRLSPSITIVQNIQPTSTRRTADQVAVATAQKLRIAQARTA